MAKNDIQSLNGSGWYLSGWVPYYWQLRKPNETTATAEADISEMPCSIPCSVNSILRENGIIPDWNYGQNFRSCEWIENRHWVFRREIVLEAGDFDLVCDGLDYNGWILWDGTILSEFLGSNHPHHFELPDAPGRHTLSIVFDLPPRWLGQFGDTRFQSVGKPRFYYSWDWMPRIVQTGITGDVSIVPRTMASIRIMSFNTGRDSFQLRGEMPNCKSNATIQLCLKDSNGTAIFTDTLSTEGFAQGYASPALNVKPWQPNGTGTPTLYTLTLSVPDGPCKMLHVGFRQIRRLPCLNAPAEADNWLFEINGETLFIQGVNWTPILPNYADVPDSAYRDRIASYKAIGVNMFRVWGGASKERRIFYDLCDENGIMVWQEFPLCSSGICNLPPTDKNSLNILERAADAYLDDLVPHPCLAIWSGGNELFHVDGGCGRPCTESEPAIALLASKVRERDTERIFVPTSASGPTEYCSEENYGKGIHYDTHGPWTSAPTALSEDWTRYWQGDDALFRSEFGSPGASDAALIQKYAGDRPLMPINAQNQLWRTPFNWWLESEAFQNQFGREPDSLDEYVAWSQARQAEALSIAISCAKHRFPKCGGVIIWMGHDSFPCPTNTSIIDFEGHWKPSAYAVKDIFTAKS